MKGPQKMMRLFFLFPIEKIDVVLVEYVMTITHLLYEVAYELLVTLPDYISTSAKRESKDWRVEPVLNLQP